MTQPALKAPFPYFGGKSTVTELVWSRLGDVPNYVEPFFGSGAVLLNRPHDPHIETVNDKDGFVANLWRAISADPEAVAAWTDNPVNENDLHARHSWLVNQVQGLTAQLEGNPEYYDAKIAGWWCWGMCCWIGSGFCSGNGPWQVVDGQLVHLGSAGMGVNRQLVHLGSAGMGVNRQLVHLGSAGMGVNRQLVHLGDAGRGVNRKRVHLGDAGRGEAGLYEWFAALANRLRNVRVCCGDWSRVCGPTPTFKQGLTGVFLDPPYSHNERATDCYREEMPCANAVREWAITNGDNPLMRIALCGYEGEHAMPDTWECVAWKAHGGYGSQGTARGRDNKHRERIWFSPHCIQPGMEAQRTLELIECM